MIILKLLQLWLLIGIIRAAPYQGGTITWKVVDPYGNGTTVDVLIYQKHSWVLSRFQCNRTVIANFGLYTDGGGAFTGEPFIQCQPSTASCSGTGFTTIRQPTYCTDFSTSVQISSGALIKRITLPRTTNIVVGYTGAAWPTQIRTVSGAPANNWRVVTRIDLRQSYYLDSSPVIASIPVIRVIEGQLAVIQFPFIGSTTSAYGYCRWASSTGIAGNECGDVCNNLPNANISDYCSIEWLAVRRPVDITAGLTTSTYVAAIMVDSFLNTTSVTSMNSVPLQVLISTYQPAAGSCSAIPEIIGDRPNRACIAAPVNVMLVERIVATVFCSGDYITEFITTSPSFMIQTAIANVSGAANQRFITLTWTPTNNQIGYNIFCAAPIDQRGLTGSQHCFYFIVGFITPNFIRPTAVQGSASPLGTVFSNHSVFSIQAAIMVYRLNRNGTYIQIFDRVNSTLVWQIDCGYSQDCIYTGTTLLFYVRNPMWTPGAHYYILFGSGVVSDNRFCKPESAPVTDPTFWTFDIWDPGFSSTTASTASTVSPPTTATVTTRPALTITPNTLLTTTGIPMTTSTSTIPTTVTTTITSASTIVTTVTTASIRTSSTSTFKTYVTTRKEPESQSKQLMIMGLVIGSPVLLLIIILFLYACCTSQKKKCKRKVFPIITPEDQTNNHLPPTADG